WRENLQAGSTGMGVPGYFAWRTRSDYYNLSFEQDQRGIIRDIVYYTYCYERFGAQAELDDFRVPETRACKGKDILVEGAINLGDSKAKILRIMGQPTEADGPQRNRPGPDSA